MHDHDADHGAAGPEKDGVDKKQADHSFDIGVIAREIVYTFFPCMSSRLTLQ